MMKRNKSQLGILYAYVGKDFLKAFLLSFVFFFFIFFINQILFLVKRILLKEVEIDTIINLVVLSIPQYLIFTVPFSTLSASCVVIGNLGADNEILALKSVGINPKKLFIPILILSIFFSTITFWISNNLIPLSGLKYRQQYSQLMQKIPTIELESYTTISKGNNIISCGKIENGIINDIQIFDKQKIISSKKGFIELLDINNFAYKIELESPTVLFLDDSAMQNYELVNSDKLILYLNFSNNITGIVSISPDQLSMKALKAEIVSREGDKIQYNKNKEEKNRQSWSEVIKEIETNNYNFKNIDAVYQNYLQYSSDTTTDYYYQSFKTEYYRKVALSISCIIFVILAFPLSFFRLKYGRLLGFGISIFIASIYWFALYFLQILCLKNEYNPLYIMSLPNIVLFIVGILLIWRLEKK